MTTLIAFAPSLSTLPPWQGVFTLDGAAYSGVAMWSLFAQRWYLSLTDQNGNLAWNGAIVGSPLTSNIFLAPNVFNTSTLLYREDTGNFEVTP